MLRLHIYLKHWRRWVARMYDDETHIGAVANNTGIAEVDRDSFDEYHFYYIIDAHPPS